MWVLDYLAEIESDLSVFHRVKDPMRLGSPRYFRLASLLDSYDGALRRAFLEEEMADSRPAPAAVRAVPVEPQPLPDITSIVAMSQNNGGFPSIAYTSGG